MSDSKDNKIVHIGDESFHIVAYLPPITLADSFVFNKVGSGSGEAKLYVGTINNPLTLEVFDRFESPLSCFFTKTNLTDYLDSAKDEFFNPTKPYRDTNKLLEYYYNALEYINNAPSEIIEFRVERSSAITPPRVYLKCVEDSKEAFHLFRTISFNGITNLSIVKLIGPESKHYLYFILSNSNEQSNVLDYLESADDEDTVSDDMGLQLGECSQEYSLKNNLMKRYPSCPFSGVESPDVLVPTIINPNAEAEDIDNNLLLSPLYSYLFKNGLISIDEDCCLEVSDRISFPDRKRLGLVKGMFVSSLSDINEKTRSFIEYHNGHIFIRD